MFFKAGALWNSILLFGKMKNAKRIRIVSKIKTNGSIESIKPRKETPHLCQINIFWGFPMGVNAEPTFTEMASNIISLEISFFNKLWMLRVRGITMNRETSLVKNVDKKAENKIRKIARVLSSSILLSIFIERLLKYPLSLIPVVIRSNPVSAITVFQSMKEGYRGMCEGYARDKIRSKTRNMNNTHSFLMKFLRVPIYTSIERG